MQPAPSSDIPGLPVIPHEALVRNTCAQVIRDALGDLLTQASMSRYRAEINHKLATGVTLTAVETADSDLMTAIDAWEMACITVREDAITNKTPLVDIPWPTPPAGVTLQWLRGF